jgi:hypothetical protein
MSCVVVLQTGQGTMGMATNSSALPRFSLRTIAYAGLASLVFAAGAASGAAADPLEVALVESLTGNLSDVAFMDYVHAGQVIRLGPQQTIVLSYMASCVRETITGGTITIGTQRSEVRSGDVQRSDGRCDLGRIELMGEPGIGGRTFRGPH